MRQKIAFLVSENYQSILDRCPDFLDEFQLLKPKFNEYEVDLVKINWRDPFVDWCAFSSLIPLGCWDYVSYAREFEIFLNNIIRLQVPMKNDAKTVLWNMRKTYLLDMQKLGLPVADFILIQQSRNLNILTVTQLLKRAPFKSEMIVAKPSIGAGAADTICFKMSDMNLYTSVFQKILSYADLILQPYFPEIANDGEYSFFFFGGQFSHAILKKPAAGDYRAHQLYGAQNLAYQPTDEEVKQAYQFFSAIESHYAYARIDVFKRRTQFFLIEIELIEPYLYFELAPKSSLDLFCRAIVGKKNL